MGDFMDIIGHRGNQDKYVENSYDAIIDCSKNNQIDGTEFDIRPTRDGNIVVIHNSKIDGNRIIDLSLEELNCIKFQTTKIDQFVQKIYNLKKDDKYFRDRYKKRGSESIQVPTLEKVLKDYDSKKHMLIELKGLDGEYSNKEQDVFEKSLIELLKKYDYKNRNIALEGYNLKALFRIKNELPDLKVVSLVNKKGNFDGLDMGVDGLSVEHLIITNDLLERIMRERLKLYSWDDKTPNKHYFHINSILENYRCEVYDGDLDLTVINDFPEEARKRIK